MSQINTINRKTIGQSIFSLAFPAVISSLVTVFYNLVDLFFIGQINDPNQVASIALTMPVFMLIIGFASVLGVGGASYVSRLLGEKLYIQAKKVSSFCFWIGLILGGIFNIVFVMNMSWLADLMGCSEMTKGPASGYLTICSYGAYFLILQVIFSFIIRAEGASKESTIGMALGTVINIILDPLFILKMDMGVQGAALATVIGAGVGTLYYLYYLFYDKQTILSISLRWFRLKKNVIQEVFGVGFPTAVSFGLMSTSIIILNNFLSSYGDVPVAAMGITVRLFSFIPLIQIGFSSGVQPLIGYNFGAKNINNLQGIIKLSCKILFLIGMGFFVVLEVFAPFFASLFIQDKEVLQLSTHFIRIHTSIAPVLGFFFFSVTILQAVGQKLIPLILSVVRPIVLLVPMVYLLSSTWGLYGIVWAQPISDILSVILAILLSKLTLRKIFIKE